MSLFKILRDASNDAFALYKVTLGLAIDGTINGIAAFGFRDSSGNATMPQLNADGSIPVSFDSGTIIRGSSKLVAASQTKDVEAELLVLDLTVTKTYMKLSADVHCFRSSLFRVVYVDDYGVTDTETELGYALIDAGQTNFKICLNADEFNTIGGIGVQKLVIYHTPLDKESDAYASASVSES